MKRLAAVLALLFATLTVLPALADEPTLLIRVGKPGDRAVPIALPSPTGVARQGAEFWGIVRRDLELSGWFKIVDPAAYVEPVGAGIRLGEFSFADWKTPGAAVLAKTSLAMTGENLRTEVWVYDVAGASRLGAKAFSSPPAGVRSLAHRVADTIITLVTGQQSFFDTKIAFAGKFGKNKEIYVMDADGAGRRQITKNASINLKPRWNHSGNALCFTSYFNGNPDMYIADLLKGQIRRLSARAGINTGCSWKPDGTELALTLSTGGDSEIFTIDPLAGAQLARLTASPGIDVSPTWSPDGSQLAFVSERGGGAQIYVMNADGTNVHRVTFSGAYNVDPSWSPTGERIAFVGRDGNFDIFTVKTDGSGMDRVTQGAGDNEDPSWSPDGQYVAFSSTRTGSAQIWLASADGRHQVQMSSGAGGYTNPNWSGHLSW